ncbi:MAG: hypothetical protein GF332_03095 [Candidatus Moranbacteria bacterium]|nr:hypothetical protein [Candidatus Moranbacteria bacterium]
MKLNKFTGSMLGMAAVAAVTMSVAYQAKANQNQKQEKGAFGQAYEAAQNNDYNAFVQAIDQRMTELETLKTQESFSTIIKAHELREQGQHQEARQLLEDADIRIPRKVNRHAHREKRRGLKQALEQNDFAKFQELTENREIGSIIDTREEFDRLVEAHELMQQGEFEQARQIKDELGLPQGPGQMRNKR